MVDKTDLKAVLLLGVVGKASAGASADRGIILYTVDTSFLRRQGRLYVSVVWWPWKARHCPHGVIPTL